MRRVARRLVELPRRRLGRRRLGVQRLQHLPLGALGPALAAELRLEPLAHGAREVGPQRRHVVAHLEVGRRQLAQPRRRAALVEDLVVARRRRDDAEVRPQLHQHALVVQLAKLVADRRAGRAAARRGGGLRSRRLPLRRLLLLLVHRLLVDIQGQVGRRRLLDEAGGQRLGELDQVDFAVAVDVHLREERLDLLVGHRQPAARAQQHRAQLLQRHESVAVQVELGEGLRVEEQLRRPIHRLGAHHLRVERRDDGRRAGVAGPQQVDQVGDLRVPHPLDRHAVRVGAPRARAHQPEVHQRPQLALAVRQLLRAHQRRAPRRVLGARARDRTRVGLAGLDRRQRRLERERRVTLLLLLLASLARLARLRTLGRLARLWLALLALHVGLQVEEDPPRGCLLPRQLVAGLAAAVLLLQLCLHCELEGGPHRRLVRGRHLVRCTIGFLQLVDERYVVGEVTDEHSSAGLIWVAVLGHANVQLVVKPLLEPLRRVGHRQRSCCQDLLRAHRVGLGYASQVVVGTRFHLALEPSRGLVAKLSSADRPLRLQQQLRDRRRNAHQHR